MINWQFYPKSDEIPDHLRQVVRVFETRENLIGSSAHSLRSDDVLRALSADLFSLGFAVETGKSRADRIQVPVRFGRNGRIEQSFAADGWNRQTATVVEIEAGRAVANYQFLKDLFEACMMHDVAYLVVAVRNVYAGGGIESRDFEKVATFFDTLYASGRLRLPLDGVLVVGY